MAEETGNKKLMRNYAAIANELAREAVFDLTKRQFDILLFMLSLVKKEDRADVWHVFTIKELSEALYINLNSTGAYYKLLTNDFTKLEQTQWLEAQDGGHIDFKWLQNADSADARKIDENGNCVTNEKKLLTFHKLTEDKTPRWSGVFHARFDVNLAPYIYKLTGNYTLIELSQVIGFTGPKSVRLYIYLKSYVYKEKLDKSEPSFVGITFHELRRILNCKNKSENSQQDNKYFIRDVLKPAINEINTKSSEFHVDVTFEKDKYTKTYNKIKFTMTKAGFTQQENAKAYLEKLKKRMEK